MAKFGIALGSGPRGLGFESRYSDHKKGQSDVLSGWFFTIFHKPVTIIGPVLYSFLCIFSLM